jgi:hypothetical protein
MRYQTYIAAVILGISPAAAFAAGADQQQPYATPQTSDSEQKSSDMTTGDQQSDAYSEGTEAKHKTGQASSAERSDASSGQNAGAQSGTGQSGAAPEAKRKTGEASSARDTKASSGQAEQSMSEPSETSDSDQQSSAVDQDEDSGGTSDAPKRMVIVVPAEMQETMEQLVAFLKSSPDAEILIMAPGQSGDEESQDVFRLQSGESSDEDED